MYPSAAPHIAAGPTPPDAKVAMSDAAMKDVYATRTFPECSDIFLHIFRIFDTFGLAFSYARIASCLISSTYVESNTHP
ncbi:hypothetical protein DOS86_00700 [Anaplasma marginale]|nr:hypothetical protein DOS86_00700 [Anaplasma marginale]